MLNTFKKDCIAAAKRLGDYQAIEVTPLADGYCKASDENDSIMKEAYMSALILRYWYKIDRLYRENPSLNLTHDDYASLLYERIDYACKYRAWQSGGTCKNASQAIQTSIATGIKNLYYFANLDKNCANYNTLSMDALNSDDDEDSSSDWLEYQLGTPETHVSPAQSVVQAYLDKKEIVQAIILDCIAFGDSTRVIKETKKVTDEEGNEVKVTESHDEFARFAVVKTINALPEDYQQYFLDKYVIGKDIFEAGLAAVKKANNQKLYKYLAKTIEELKNDKDSCELLFN